MVVWGTFIAISCCALVRRMRRTLLPFYSPRSDSRQQPPCFREWGRNQQRPFQRVARGSHILAIQITPRQPDVGFGRAPTGYLVELRPFRLEGRDRLLELAAG